MSTPEELVAAATEGTLSLSAILDSVERFLRRFVSFSSDAQAAAVVLWTAHVYAIDAAPTAAYLRITSAVEESGKTTLLELLEQLLGDHCLNLISATPAFVFRMRDKVGPIALLLDEIDNTLKDRKDEGARDLLALVNGGYRRSAKVGRTTGRDHEGRQFKAFGPAAIAGLGSLHPATESRCIPVVLERKERGAGERFLSFLVEDEARAIASRLTGWASSETLAALKTVRPELPTELRDRHAEAWWSLLAIADRAGGDWPKRARMGALSLHANRDAEDSMSLGVVLLEHIRKVTTEHEVDRVASAQLIRWLVELAEGPWARWWGADVDRHDHGDMHALDKAAASLTGKLKPFRKREGDQVSALKPHVLRLADGSMARGYLLSDFDDAFARHLSLVGVTGATGVTPLASADTRVTRVTPGNQGEDGPCPGCGARSAAKGYNGHAEGCAYFYGRTP
ncbi:MAG: DUF3631 domain-containing protein [Actinomycetota bacterium]|nr:DUF3631 domain-containing protein [Actinomycetota bacterium]